MKALILSCNTGQGHNSCAAAISEAFRVHGDECDTVDSLGFISEAASKIISGFHTTMYRKAPKMFKSGYKGAKNHDSIFRDGTAVNRFLTSGAERLYEYVMDGGYDTLICTHVFPALALTAMKNAHPDTMPQSCYVSTDYTCSPSTSDSELDWYFIPHESLIDEFAACGVPLKKIIVSGMPAKNAFYEKENKAEAKLEVGVSPDKRHILLMCGSMGCGPLPEMSRALCDRLGDDTELTVVCGTNESLYEKLCPEYADDERVHIKGKVSNVPRLMHSAELFITKPGGLSTTEAAAAGVPMLLIDTVAGCEEHNLDFFTRQGAAVTADTTEKLADTAFRLLSDPERLERMAAALACDANCTPSEYIYRFLLGSSKGKYEK